MNPESPCADFLYATDEPDSGVAEPSDAPSTVTLAATPRLTDYDVILVNSSAGKDSQAALDVVAGAARDAAVLERLVVRARRSGRRRMGRCTRTRRRALRPAVRDRPARTRRNS